MRSRIARGAYVLGVLAFGCALLMISRPAQAGSVQEGAAQPSTLTKHEEELARKKKHEQELQQQQAHVPEIDGATIPTALALLGAGVVMLRARLRSTK